MSDIKLFRTSNGTVEELKGTSVQLEKSLQTLIEKHLEAFLAIRFVASEHSTGDIHRGRMMYAVIRKLQFGVRSSEFGDRSNPPCEPGTSNFEPRTSNYAFI